MPSDLPCFRCGPRLPVAGASEECCYFRFAYDDCNVILCYIAYVILATLHMLVVMYAVLLFMMLFWACLLGFVLVDIHCRVHPVAE